MTKASSTDRYLIQARLPHKAEQERFESLVTASGLSKADYVRQCCLEALPIVVPSFNLQLYGKLGALHVTLKRAVEKTPTPELETALDQVQALRLSLVGMLAEESTEEDNTAL